MRNIWILSVAALAMLAGCELSSGDKEPLCDGYEIGETWDVECNTCECTADGPACTLLDCAPECDGHEVGDTWEAEDGCNTCSCSEEGMACTEMACLPDCDGHQPGETWDADDGCNTCTCTEEGIACTLMACLPDCDGHELGETWDADDGCNTCTCTEDGVACTEMACPPGCDGHEIGETWEADDGCNTCTCTDFGVACTQVACPKTCEEVTDEYYAMLDAAGACAEHADCQYLWAVCGEGMGSCYVIVNMSISQEDIAAIEQEFLAANCQLWDCACTLPPAVMCEAGVCVAGPDCDGHALGESWDADDGCNVCSCTPDGIVCTAMWCPPETCEDIQETYADLVADNSGCDVTEDCQVLWGQCGQGLGGCYEAVNGNVTQDELNALGQKFAEQGCTQWVCDCAPPPEVECKDHVCTAIPE